MIRTVLGVAFTVEGDGTTTKLVVDMTKPPLSLNLQGNLPVDVRVQDPPGTQGEVDGKRLTLQFAVPPTPWPALVNVSLFLFFEGR